MSAVTTVTYICHMGTDDLVVDAARTSLAKAASNYTAARNASLIRYLARSSDPFHFAPFTHPQVCFHVGAPIYVARQLWKSRIGFSPPTEPMQEPLTEPEFAESEVSRRYVDAAPSYHLPVWRERMPGVKQGSGKELDPVNADYANEIWSKAMSVLDDAYGTLLRLGIAPEQARSVLPVTTHTEFYWTGSLAAWARLYQLRFAPDAQRETGFVAVAVGAKMAELFPVSWEALTGNAG